MMHSSSFLSALAALACLIPVHGFKPEEPTTLFPLDSRLLEKSFENQRRDDLHVPSFHPKPQAQLLYGRPTDKGELLLADMTLHAPDGMNIVKLEEFDGLTKSIDCKGDDGSMSLTFKSLDIFKKALKAWDFINEAEENKFLLIANHNGCGPDDQRQPYLITNIREDESALTTFLTAQVASWSQVAGTYELDWGKVLAPKSGRRMKERDLFGDIGKSVNGVVSGVTKGIEDIAKTFEKIGDVDISKSVAFDVSIGKPGVRTNIISNSDKSITLDCINCFISGSFKVTGHLVVKDFSLQDLTLEASPQNVIAKLELEATIKGSDTLLSVDDSKELFAIGLPGAGIAVTGIFKLGATASYDVGASSTFKGQGIVDFGIQASLPNSAKVIADVQKGDASGAVGFEGAGITPIFNVKSLTATVNLVAYSKAKISFGIDVVAVGHVNAAITLQVPKVTSTLTFVSDSKGVCSTTAGSTTTGVKLDSKVDIEVNLDLDAALGASSKPAVEKKLFAISDPLAALCLPLDLGIPIGPPTTPAKAQPAPVPQAAPAPQPTPIPQPAPAPQPSTLATEAPTSVPGPAPTSASRAPASPPTTSGGANPVPSGPIRQSPAPSGITVSSQSGTPRDGFRHRRRARSQGVYPRLGRYEYEYEG